MGSYRVALTASAEKELRRIPSKTIERIIARLEGFAQSPRPHGCKKLRGGDVQWRVRVGEYRIVYEIDDVGRSVVVTRIAHRRDVYE